MAPKHRRVFATSVLVGILAIAAAGSFPGPSIAGRPRARGLAAPALDPQLRALVAMPGGPSGVIAIVQRFGHSRVYRAGVSDVRSRRPIESSDHMRLASTAKAFSGAVGLALVDHCVLSLGDTIAKWLPQLPKAWGAVTLREALNHTSGLPDFSTAEGFKKYLTAHLHATPSPMFLLRFIARKRLEFDPGAKYHYSNTDNFVVALMAEAAAHHDYNKLLASKVYSPLRLRQTTLPTGPGMPLPYIHGYQPDPPNRPEDVSLFVSATYAWASGGLVSTPADLNGFIRGYAGARLCSRRTQRDQLHFVKGSSEPAGPGENMAGLGIFLYRTRCGTVYGHTGNTIGYTQFMAATRDGKRSVTVSINEQLTGKSLGDQLAAFKRLRQIEENAVCAALA
jgi:D-alanyl-D-alanine carboxypeptidase